PGKPGFLFNARILPRRGRTSRTTLRSAHIGRHIADFAQDPAVCGRQTIKWKGLGQARTPRGGVTIMDGRRRRRGFTPGVTTLETRALCVINSTLTTINPVPRVLPNTPDGRQIIVTVSGVIASNHPQAPAGFFTVTDGYGADEPRGRIALG